MISFLKNRHFQVCILHEFSYFRLKYAGFYVANIARARSYSSKLINNIVNINVVQQNINTHIRIKSRAALRFYIVTGIFIPANARCCVCRLVDDGFLNKDALASIQATFAFAHMNAESIFELLNDLRDEARKNGRISIIPLYSYFNY